MGTYTAFCALSTKAVKEAREDGKQPVWGTDPRRANEAATTGNGNDPLQRKRRREADGAESAASGGGIQPPFSKRRPAHEEGAAGLRTNGRGTPIVLASSSSSGSLPRSGSHGYMESDAGIEGGGGGGNAGGDGLSFAGVATSTHPRRGDDRRSRGGIPEHGRGGGGGETPLFFPETSQSSDGRRVVEPAGSQVLRDAGLQDIERMTQAELRAMLDDDDEEMNEINGGVGGGASMEDVEMESTFEDVQDWDPSCAPTQRSKEDDFRPLFDD